MSDDISKDGKATGIGRPATLGFTNVEDEYLAALQGLDRYDTYREMGKSDAALAAILRSIRWVVAQADYHMVGGDDRVREFVEPQVMPTMNLHMRDASRFIQYGNYAFEQIFDIVDGRTVEKGILPRPPWTYFRFLEESGTGRLIRIDQREPGVTGHVPSERMVLHVLDPDGESNQGESIFRPARKHWLMWSKAELYDMIGLERMARGVPIAMMKDGADQEAIDNVDGLLQRWRVHEEARLVLKTAYVESLEIVFSNYDNASTWRTINSHRAVAFKAAMQQFFTIGSGDGSAGSNARAITEVDFFFQAVEYVARLMVDTTNNIRIKRIADLNFTDIDEYPIVKVSNIRRPNTEQIGEYLNNVKDYLIADAGMDGFTRRQIGAPPPGVGEEGQDIADTGESVEGVALQAGNRGPVQAAEAFVALTTIEERMDDREMSVKERLQQIRAAQVERLVGRMAGAIKSGNVATLAEIQPTGAQDYRRTISQNFEIDWRFGFDQIFEELDRQERGEPVVEDTFEERFDLQSSDDLIDDPEIQALRDAQMVAMNTQAAETSAALAAAVTAETKRAAIAGVTLGLAAEEIAANATTAGLATGNGLIANGSSLAATNPIQFGRMAGGQANAPRISRGYYSAVFDRQTCGPCADADGVEVTTDRPIPTAPNTDCDGSELRCRCIHVWVLSSESASLA